MSLRFSPIDWLARARGLTAMAILFLLLGLTGIGMLIAAGFHEHAAIVPWIGNRREAVDRLAPCAADAAFSFAVVGDPEDGMPTFRILLEKMRERKPAFLLITGDAVRRPMRARFEYLITELRKAGWSVPVFVAPGNSDVDVEAGDASLFEEFLGARVFHFEYGGCLFLLLDNSMGHVTTEQIAEADRWLGETRARYRHVFMALHRPLIQYFHWPQGVKKSQNESGCEDILDLVRRRKVDWVLTGHLHSYVREQRDGTTHVITGGGGGVLQTPDAQYHYVEMRVGPGAQVEDEMFGIGSARNPWDMMGSDWHTQIQPRLADHPVRWALADLAALLACAVCWLMARRRRWSEQGRNEEAERMRRAAAVALAVFVIVVICAAVVPPVKAHGDEETEPEAPKISPDKLEAKVRVETAKTGDLRILLRAIGLVSPRSDEPMAVTTPQAGRVARVEVREGQTVKAGEVLVALDDRPIQESLAKAQAAVRAAELELARARDFGLDAEQAELDLAATQAQATARAAHKEAERQKELLAANLASEKAATETQQAAEAAERAALAAAEKLRMFRESGRKSELAKLEAALEASHIDVRTEEREIEWAVIHATRDGRVCAPPIAAGRWVEAGAVVVQVVSERTVAVTAQLSPADAGTVVPDAAAGVLLGARPAIAGKVRTVSRIVDPETGLVPVEIVCEDAGCCPRIGEACYVDIDTGAAAHGLLLPASALSTAEDSASVVVVDDKDIAHVIPVRLLARGADQIVVEGEGLADGARVVVEGNFNLPDGAHVVPEPTH